DIPVQKSRNRRFCGSGRGEAVIRKTEPNMEERTFAELRRKGTRSRAAFTSHGNAAAETALLGKAKHCRAEWMHFEVRIRRGLFHPPARRADDPMKPGGRRKGEKSQHSHL